MTEKVPPPGSHGQLEAGMANLAQHQAALVQTQATFQAEFRETQRQRDECFARIKALLTAITQQLEEQTRVLAEHSRLLEQLPEAILEKIGFNGPQQGKQESNSFYLWCQP